jgi:hypothetical protein
MLDKVFPRSGAIPIVYTDDKKRFLVTCVKIDKLRLGFHVIKSWLIRLISENLQIETALFSVEVHWYFRQRIFGIMMNMEYCQVCEMLLIS